MLTIKGKSYHWTPPYEVLAGEQNIIVLPGDSIGLFLLESIGDGPDKEWPGIGSDSVVLPLGSRVTPLAGKQMGKTRTFKMLRGIPTMIPEYLMGAYAPLIDPGQEKY